MSEAPRLNRYYCKWCARSIITVDCEEGVTPAFLACRATPNCGGTMASRFYQVEDFWDAPTFEWRKPKPKQYKKLSAAMKQHVDQGGLLIYPIVA